MEEIKLNEHNKQEYPPMHSAEHLLNGEMARRFGCGRAFSGYVNAAVDADVEVWEEYISQEEAMGRFDMSRLPDEASETVRVVHIGDYDQCLCAGTHVKSTSEIGHFRITSSRFQDGVQRLVFKLGE